MTFDSRTKKHRVTHQLTTPVLPNPGAGVTMPCAQTAVSKLILKGVGDGVSTGFHYNQAGATLTGARQDEGVRCRN